MQQLENNSIDASQHYELEKFGRIINTYGANFAMYTIDGELAMLCEADKFKSDEKQLIEFGRRAIEKKSEKSNSNQINPHVWKFSEDNLVLAVVLESMKINSKRPEIIGTALIDLGNTSAHVSCEMTYDIENTNRNKTDVDMFVDMLRLIAEKFDVQTKAGEQIEKVSTELARVYEELVLLHRISTNMKVTEADSNFLQMACDSLTEIVFVEGIAILLEKNVESEQQLVIAAGSGLIDIDEHTADTLYSRLSDEINEGKDALLDSEVDAPFKYNWPDTVKNIIAVPLCSKERGESSFSNRTQDGSYIMGLMVAINRIGKQDFDSTDVKLFSSVASGCAVFIENRRLFKDIKELFIGSLKALTSSIDAKDNYTHGHSDRVAFISRWIAERLSEQEQLEDEQLHKVYLAGLLHDIGKIGIDETVLRKTGKLTEEEYKRIKMHPSIGAGILREIKQMRDIVPGVLCHHERIDGKGYPNGLTGEQIPLTGKIIGLADSFDAMTSKRTYRDAMSVEQALIEIEKGLGTQFDEKIGRIFLESDVYQLWEIMRDGFSEIYRSSAFAEYGTAAVGMLIK